METGKIGGHMSPRARLITGLVVGAAVLTGAGFGINYLATKTDAFAGPKTQMLHTLNESNLSMDDRMYLFEYNAPLVDPAKGIAICDSGVIDRATDAQQLEYLLGEVKETPTKEYGPILGAMAEKVGTDIYTTITNFFKGGN